MFAPRIARALSSQSISFLCRQTMCMMSTVSPDGLFNSFGASSDIVGKSVPEAMFSLYNADAVCFDVDSTVIDEEGIDVLAEYLGKGKEVAELTKQAMEGDTKFQDALQMRLDLMKPSKSQIEDLLNKQPLVLTNGVASLVKNLHEKNVDVWLVSGGFRIMIEPVAKELNIPISNIVANHILFDDDGKYQGFDKDEPTSRDMGKPKALEQIGAKNKYETIVMIGDGATDAQAKPPAAAFIGFGGVVEREAVKEKADWFVLSFDDLTKIVQMRP